MCGRYAQSKPALEYAHALDSSWSPSASEFKPTWNMAPGRQSLVFLENQEGRAAELLHWGFLPPWADAKSHKPINARLETADTSPFFRQAWKSCRCLIPADGWYEWKQGEHGKQPFFMHYANQEPVFMAGLYAINQKLNITSFAILTNAAQGKLADIHQRKPLILPNDVALQWISRIRVSGQVKALTTQSADPELFSLSMVSTLVNNARNDGEDMLQSV